MELLDPGIFSLLLLLAFTAGFVDAVAGGGGAILLPALLTAGLPPHLALGTNKLAATFGSTIAALTYVRRGLFKPTLWKGGMIATFVGACTGTLATFLFSPDALRVLLPPLIIAAAIWLLLQRRLGRVENPTRYQPAARSSGALGGALGFYDGFFGPGTGSFWTTLVMSLYPVGIVEASGVARFMNWISNAVSLFTFMALGSVRFGVGLPLGVALMVGAWLGARSAIRFGGRFIRPLLVGVTLILAGRLIWVEWLS
ncbi:MAG: TSUP family transporter [Gammaproteobacteria bacterium]